MRPNPPPHTHIPRTRREASPLTFPPNWKKSLGPNRGQQDMVMLSEGLRGTQKFPCSRLAFMDERKAARHVCARFWWLSDDRVNNSKENLTGSLSGAAEELR